MARLPAAITDQLTAELGSPIADGPALEVTLQQKNDVIRDHYIFIMAPLFFPEKPTEPDIIQLFASLLRVVGMEDKGWDPYAESRAVLDDLYGLIKLELPKNTFKDCELTAWRLGLIFYNHIVEMDAPYEVLTNLLRYRLGKGYSPNPYYDFLTADQRRLTNPLIFVDARVAALRAGCVAASAHVGLEHRDGQGGSIAQAA